MVQIYFGKYFKIDLTGGIPHGTIPSVKKQASDKETTMTAAIRIACVLAIADVVLTCPLWLLLAGVGGLALGAGLAEVAERIGEGT